MLPEIFLMRMQAQLGPDYSAFLQSLERPRAVALRFNPLKGEAPSLPFVGAPVPWEPLGFYYDPETRPGLHPYHEAGVYYLQEASAMAPVALLDPQPGERVLDLCAAPGGKSTQIAGRMQGQGLLWSNEYVFGRARILSQNLERLGVPNAIVTSSAPQRLSQSLEGFFDRVLVDAPCSGEGMFRKEAAAITDWSQETVEMCAGRQLDILREAAKMLRPGGRLVYSTCTFALEENEGVVAKFLAEHPDFTPEDVQAPWFDRVDTGSFRLWPHKLLGEGHFAAVFRKNGEEPAWGRPCPGQKLPREWTDFARELDISLPEGGKGFAWAGRLYWAPEAMPELNCSCLRMGLELGELKKNRFEPSHALAMWLTDCKNQVSFPADSKQIKDYINGQVLPCQHKGWCLVKADAFSLGWGKGDGNQLKNHYPKGLRR